MKRVERGYKYKKCGYHTRAHPARTRRANFSALGIKAHGARERANKGTRTSAAACVRACVLHFKLPQNTQTHTAHSATVAVALKRSHANAFHSKQEPS